MDARAKDAPTSSISLARQQVQVLKIAEGFFDSRILFACNELGVFEALGNGPLSLDQVVGFTGASRDGMERLLNAAVALTLLDLDQGRYANGPLAQDVLVPGKPAYLGNWLRLMSRYQATWIGLTEAVRTGRPVDDPWRYLGGDEDATQDFVQAMDDYARLRGSEVVRHLDMPPDGRVLDLGGGPGSYAIMFARRWPDLGVTILELPEVARIAERNVRAAGVNDRVTVVAGDMYQDDLGSDFDVVFLSDVLHQADPKAAETVVSKAWRAMKPGGRIVVQAMFLNEDRVSPRWPTIVSLNLLALYGSGRSYTVGETMELLRGAGFTNARHQRMSLMEVNSLVLAEKPA
jgi:SAM-dependent methyltransferase